MTRLSAARAAMAADALQFKITNKSNIAKFITSNGDATVSEVASSTGIAHRTASRYMREMQKDGVLSIAQPRISKGRGIAPAVWTVAGTVEDAGRDWPARKVVTQWTLGAACRDALVAALFGANGRARA